jgi:hypothetical protein
LAIFLAKRALALGAVLAVIAACGQDSVEDKIEVAHEGAARNTQTYATGLFEDLCAARAIDDTACACMRDRMLRAGTKAMAFVGATYGGNLAEAAATAEAMDAAELATAIQAYVTAETVCRDMLSGPGNAAGNGTGSEANNGAGGDGPAPPATLDDVRASCQPAMAEVCACRARALEQTLGDGAYEAAIAINTGSRARLDQLAARREEGWAGLAADAYARTSAPCIVQTAQ